ncbi:C_GCAxxG_C_C family protein [candidate division WOR-3 bacterium]|nr:C_GCAxxG_C_C family protein [candidate division WOR-3 bacterium]
MKEKEKLAENAVSLFRSGFNCAESVLMTMQDYLGLEKNPSIATGFGGGIGRKGSVCGAVSGGVLAINLKYGRKKSEEEALKEKAFSKALEFYKKFEKKMGSAVCYDIIKCDLTTEEGQKTFKENNLLEEKCFKCVEASVNILLDIFEERD